MHGKIWPMLEEYNERVHLQFSINPFAFLQSELESRANWDLTEDEELEQWEIREMLPPI